MIISAKEFAARTGFPVKLIRRMCRTGQLAHWQSGRVYLLDEEKALRALELYKAVPIYEPKKQGRNRNVNKLPEKYASRTERLKALIAKRKTAGAATPAVKDLGKRK